VVDGVVVVVRGLVCGLLKWIVVRWSGVRQNGDCSSWVGGVGFGSGWWLDSGIRWSDGWSEWVGGVGSGSGWWLD